jgi:phosphoribosylcarboxyaminoimidazole (NCAIR) mutase
MIVVPIINIPVYADDEKTIIELWGKVQAPAPVELKAVKINPKDTAFSINFARFQLRVLSQGVLVHGVPLQVLE